MILIFFIIFGNIQYIKIMKKIMFCGGGSAGHVIPNISIIEELKKDYAISYIGTDGIEKQICNSYGIEFYQFEAVKFVRGKIFCNIAIPFKLFKSIRQAKEIIWNVKPDLLFCKGGYVCLPPAFAASKLKLPVLTHESDLTMGLANKLIASKCKHVLTSFPETSQKIKNGVYAGTPMRKNLFNRSRIESKKLLGLDNRPTIIVFGGGSGSKIINSNLRKILFKLCSKFNVLHLCGKGNLQECNINGYKQIEFADDMGAVYACADFAVSRCGSNSANELIALKIPTLFIPLSKNSSRGDQIKNAEYFKNKGLCKVLSESQLNETAMLYAIEELYNDEKLKISLKYNNSVCGNDKIIDIIKSVLE